MMQAVADRYLVASTTGSRAIQAGAAALAEGGNAMDAALTIALGQVVSSAGSWCSLAGILSLLYFDASAGQTHSLDAGFRTFSDERQPLTIPGRVTAGIPSKSIPSGRSALVPGFMAGLQEAHERFGRLPFARLFEPAIRDAERGIVIDDVLDARFERRQLALKRLPATAAVYAPAGSVPKRGDCFLQPALADTLRSLARDGADYVYRGEWAERFVQAVRTDGGKARLEDLRGYRAEWGAARCIDYRDARVCTVGGRNGGGVALLESLQIAQAAGLRELGSITTSADALYWTVRALQVGMVMQFSAHLLPDEPTFVSSRLPGVSPAPDARVSVEQAKTLVEHIRSGRWDQVMVGLAAANLSSHSDAIAVVDAQGNACALTHTLGSETWGATCLNVGGVSIPDAAATHPGAVALAGPGGYVPSLLNPALVFEADRLRLVASAIGNPHYAMFGYLGALLNGGLPIAEAVKQRIVSGQPFQEMVPPGSVPQELLDTVKRAGLHGLDERVDRRTPHWVGIEATSDSAGRLRGAITPELREFGGAVLGR